MNSNKSSTILIIGNFFSQKTGVRQICEDLFSQLKNSGWNVYFISSYQNIVLRFFNILFTILKKRKNIQLATIDLFSGKAFLWAELSAFLLRQLHIPYLLVLHGGNLYVFSEKNKKRVLKLLQSATHVIAPSSYLQRCMTPYNKNILLIPNPIYLDRYSFRLRQHIQPKILWLRTFHPNYNPILAVKVLASLKERGVFAHLTMVGPTTNTKSLKTIKQLIQGLNLVSQTTLAGKVLKEEVPLWINQNDIFINTSNIDNTPVTVIEAMASGLCVVSTNSGGMPDLIDHEINGLLVPPNDEKTMADAILLILNQPSLAEKLSRSARQKTENYDWKKILPQWEQLFRSMVTS